MTITTKMRVELLFHTNCMICLFAMDADERLLLI